MNALDTGKIEEGYRADLVIYDTNMKWKITAENTHMADWTPYEGYEVIGKPRYVFRNGDLVLDDGEIKEGKGKLLRRTDID